MNNQIPYKAVGIFVVSLLMTMIVIIVWLSSGLTFTTYRKYTVYMRESVSGLNLDSPVEFNGVNVGAVKSLALSIKNPHLVNLTLSIKEDTPITEGTVATLGSRGLTGLMYIALKDDNAYAKPLLRQKDELYPVIKTAPSIFSRVDTTLTKLSESFQVISASLNRLLNDDNQYAIRQILSNTELITRTIALHRGQLATATENFALSSQKLPKLMEYTQESMQTIRSDTLPKSDSVLTQLNQLTQSLNELTSQLKQNPSLFIRGQHPAPPGPGE